MVTNNYFKHHTKTLAKKAVELFCTESNGDPDEKGGR
jgi:hypothetical protein